MARRTTGEGRQDEVRASRADNTTFKVFHETRNTRHESRLFPKHCLFLAYFGRRAGRDAGQAATPAAQPLLAYLLFPGISQYFPAKNIALSQCQRTVRRSRSASPRAPLAAKSHKSAQNPVSPRKMREAQLPSPPRAGPAAVDANGYTARASAAKSSLIRVDSCPFVVNEPF